MSMDVAKHALREHDPALSRTMRYEDLLGEPAEILEDLLAWIGVERDRRQVEATVNELSFASLPSAAVGELKRNRSASPGAWRENLSTAEAALVAEIAGERLERYGYPPA
jgi:hypothetical protein